MLETPHVLVGAAIATKVVHPALAIPLALGSHFILEKVPHWNPHLNSETKKYGRVTKKTIIICVIDSLTALLAGSFIASRALPNTGYAATIFFSCFAAALPDVVEAPYYFLGIKNKIIKKWIEFQRPMQENASLIPGLLTQFVVIIAALWWTFQ